MFLATASTTASPAAATPAAATAVFYEQILGWQRTIDNDTAATIGDNDRERDNGDHGSSGGERRGFAEPRYVPAKCTSCVTEYVHAAPRDATGWTTGDPDSLVDTHRQRYLGHLRPVVRSDLQRRSDCDSSLLHGNTCYRKEQE